MPSNTDRALRLVAVLFACLSAAATSLRASAPLDLTNLGAPSFESFTARDGLPDGVITTIGVDADGFAWAASARGLYRFLGHRWQREVREQVAGRFHRRMFLDAAGTLWLGVNDGGLGRLRGSRWEFMKDASGLPRDGTYRVSQFRDSKGRLRTWLLTIAQGLYELQGNEWRPDPGNASLPGGSLISMGATTTLFGGPRQWLGTGDHGLWFRRDGETRWHQFSLDGKTAGQTEGLQRTIEPDGEALWVSIFSAGVYRITDRQTKRWCVENGALRSNDVYEISLSTGEGGTTVWVPSRDGLVRIRGGATEIFDRRHGLPSDQIRCVELWKAPSGEEVLWIATEAGVARAVFTGDRWRTVSLMGAGSIGAFGVSVEPDGTGGERVWVASNRDGVGLYQGGRWRTFTQASGDLPANNVRAVKRRRDLEGHDALWVAVDGGYLLKMRDDLHLEQVKPLWPIEPGEVAQDILSREYDGKRELWFATRMRGIFRWRDDGWIATPILGAAGAWRATQLAEQVDRNGGSWLWATTNLGLARFDGDHWTPIGIHGLPQRNMIGITVAKESDGRQVLWIGSSFDGLFRVDVTNPRSPVVVPPNDLPPLIDSTVYSALHDSKGRVYLATNDGVQQLTPDAKGWRNRVFRRRDGLVNDECNTNAQFIDAHDRFWTGTLGGVTVFDPTASIAASPKRLRLIGATKDDRDVLHVEYTLQSWQREDETRYRTQLVGFEGRPSAWTPEPQRTLAALPPGDYRLKIEAKDFAGIAAVPVELPFTVIPKWWQRAPVQGGFILAGMLLILATANWRTRTLRAQKARLEAEVAARTEELNHANANLRELSYTDALTGLPNRRKLLEALDSLPNHANPALCSLIFIDVDHFKEYNDRLGHPAGDAALRTVAATLRACAPHALVARYGGEEFACLLAGHSLDDAGAFAERMRAETAAQSIPVPGGDAVEHITISAGVASANLAMPADTHGLLREADNALYRAKSDGRNCVR